MGRAIAAVSIIIAVCGVTLFLDSVGAQEGSEGEMQEARCIEENWPWSEEPPASIDALREGVATIEEVCLPEPETEVMYAQRGANVREKPRLDAARIGRLAWADPVNAACGVEGDEWNGSTEWCQVDDGFVHSALLGEDEPVAQPAAAQPAAAQPAGIPCPGPGCVAACTRTDPGQEYCSEGEMKRSRYDPFGGGGEWAANGWVGNTWYEYWVKRQQ